MKEVLIKGELWLIDLENKKLILKSDQTKIKNMDEDQVDHFRSIVQFRG